MTSRLLACLFLRENPHGKITVVVYIAKTNKCLKTPNLSSTLIMIEVQKQKFQIEKKSALGDQIVQKP